MNTGIKATVIIFILFFLANISWSFSLFKSKDIEYYKKHRDQAEKKLEACEMALWSSNGDIKAIEKIQNNNECKAAKNAIKFFKNQEKQEKLRKIEADKKAAQNKYSDLVAEYSKLSLNELDKKAQSKCGIGGGLFNSPYSECHAIQEAKKIVYKPTVEKFSSLTLKQLREKANNCSGNMYGQNSECSAVEQARLIVHKKKLVLKEKDLSSLNDKEIFNLTNGPKSKCYNVNIKSLYCESARQLRKKRIKQYKELYINNDQKRTQMYDQCNQAYRKIVKQTRSILLDWGRMPEPLKCQAVSRARQLKGEDSRYYSR